MKQPRIPVYLSSGLVAKRKKCSIRTVQRELNRGVLRGVRIVQQDGSFQFGIDKASLEDWYPSKKPGTKIEDGP